MNPRAKVFDAELLLEDGAAAITADGAGSEVLDLGTGLVQADVVVDVSAIDVAGTDEVYLILMELSNEANFATAGDIVSKVALVLAASAVKPGASTREDTVGRHIFTFDNEHRGTKYRYARMYVDVTGATCSITMTAFATNMHRV